MKHGTGFIQLEDRHALNLLRLREYQKAPGFQIQDQAVLWNKSDDDAVVLGVWNRGELISTMRLESIPDLKTLEYKIEAPAPGLDPILFPVGILSKAATLQAERGGGLNAHLRYYLLRIAIERKIGKIFGTLVKGAPRSKSLVDMGYEFHEHPTGWTSPYYRSTAPVQIVSLDLKAQGERALLACAKLASQSLLIYPWIGKNEQQNYQPRFR